MRVPPSMEPMTACHSKKTQTRGRMLFLVPGRGNERVRSEFPSLRRYLRISPAGKSTKKELKRDYELKRGHAGSNAPIRRSHRMEQSVLGATLRVETRLEEDGFAMPGQDSRILRQIDDRVQCRDGRRADRPAARGAIHGTGVTRTPRSPSRPWSGGTVRWCCASAGASSATTTTPRMRSRRPS